MTALKTLTVTVLAWGFLGSIAEAAPLSSWFSGPGNLSTWYANQSFANGGFYAPASAPAPVLANSDWYNNPGNLSSLGIVSAPASAAVTAAHSLERRRELFQFTDHRVHQFRQRPLRGNEHPDHGKPPGLV